MGHDSSLWQLLHNYVHRDKLHEKEKRKIREKEKKLIKLLKDEQSKTAFLCNAFMK